MARTSGWLRAANLAVAMAAIGTLAGCARTRSDVAPALGRDSTAQDVGWYAVEGRGFVTDASHPWHPGDFRKFDIVARLKVDAARDECVLELESRDGDTTGSDFYYLRDGRVFQMDEKKGEIEAAPFGDVSPAAVAMLHPALAEMAMRARPENTGGNGAWFAANGVLWSVAKGMGEVALLTHPVADEVYGDRLESVRYTGFRQADLLPASGAVSVETSGRETLHLDFGAAASTAPFDFPKVEMRGDDPHRISRDAVQFAELAPGIFAIDLKDLNSRVFVAEFADHLMVIEGAYSSRVCDALAQAVRSKFGKPVRYFAFSHLHGQYLGGTRSWVALGAIVLAPPGTIGLVANVAGPQFKLRPDALSRAWKQAKLEVVEKRLLLEDASNAVEVFNVESQHTDDYLVFYFPRQKMLLTGDLLFYRPGKPLAGRSLKIAQTARELGLDVEKYVATWPLDGFGTKNIVTRAEVEAAMHDAN